jgi:ABC-type nickel/cobalt efflux system permease component RcnA
VVLLGTTALALLPAGAASAHPLGNFTINTADRLVVTEQGVEVTHVVDLAEIPSVALRQARAGADTDGDRDLSERELAAYAELECGRIGPQLDLAVDGSRAPLQLLSSAGRSSEGAAGLPVTRIECSYVTQERPREDVRFSDPVAAERNGWREVSATSLCGPLLGSDAPEDSPSELLASYPEDLLQSPVDVTSAQFAVDGDAACTSPIAGGVTTDEVAPRGVDRLSRTFTDFLGRKALTVPFALLSVAAAVVFGVLHAMAPGHGKTVMAAYLVGQRGTRRQAVHLGAVVTFTHTASVLLLGLLLTLGALAAPELVVPITEVLSGVLLALVGVYLVVLALRRRRAGHEHPHPHDQDHDHDHDQDHDHRHEHDHPHEHDHAPHGGQHDHHHTAGSGDHHDHPHPVPVGSGRASARAEGPLVLAARPLEHSHGGRTHTHAPLPDGPLSWKTLVSMGVAGGLVPSPSALLVLLGATALGRAWFGVLLVLAYGVGMAVTLTVAGLLLLRAQALLDRRGWSAGRGRHLVALLPLLTAGIVVVIGLLLVLRGISTGRGLL